MMASVRWRDTTPEKIVRKFLHSLGYRFRLHARDLPGRPDIVLPGRKTAILVHGCFWHAHEGCRRSRLPATRSEWWKGKITGNRQPDEQNEKKLADDGWKVLVIWECQCKDDSKLRRLAKKIDPRFRIHD